MTRHLVVESDGGSRGNPGPAAFGAVVKDADTGELLAELAETLGVATNNVAEYSGLVAGLRAAARVDSTAQVEVRMDSKLVVEQMSGRWKVRHRDLRPLATQAREAFPYEQITWTWIPREQNTHADRLLNEALDQATGRPRKLVAREPIAVDESEPQPPTSNILVAWSELGPPTTLILVRHGETSATVEKRFSGLGGSDPGLLPTGEEQVRAAAEALKHRDDVAAIVASPLRRTRESAEIVAGALGLDVSVEEGFAETAFGEWDGLTFEEARERWPAELEAWLADPGSGPPGGESAREVAQRVAQARDATLARFPGRTVVVVTHVTPITMLVRLALDAPEHAVWRMRLNPASVTEIAYYADGITSLHGFNRSG